MHDGIFELADKKVLSTDMFLAYDLQLFSLFLGS